MTRYRKALELWQQKNIRTDAELAEALNGHSILFAFHSGKLENDHITYHDTREIFEHDGVTSYTGDLRTLFEIRNARDAHELFLNAFRDRRPPDEAFLMELQLQLTKGTYDTRRLQLGERPGTYKLHDHPPITIHEEDRLGYYNALEAWDTGQELAPLITFLQAQAEKTWEKLLTRAEKS